MLQPSDSYWYFQKNQHPPPYNADHGRNSAYPASTFSSSTNEKQVSSQPEHYQRQTSWSSSSHASNVQGNFTSGAVTWAPPYMGYENLEPSRAYYNFQKSSNESQNKNFSSLCEQPQSQHFMETHSKNTSGNYDVSQFQNNKPAANVPRIRVRDMFSLNNSFGNETSSNTEERNEIRNSGPNLHSSSITSNAQAVLYGNVNYNSNLYHLTFQNQTEPPIPSSSFQETDSNTVIWRPHSQYIEPSTRGIETSVPLSSYSSISHRNVVSPDTLLNSLRSSEEQVSISGNYNSMPGLNSNVLVNAGQFSQQTNKNPLQLPTEHSSTVSQTSRSTSKDLISGMLPVFADSIGPNRNGDKFSISRITQPNISVINANQTITKQNTNPNNIQVANFSVNLTHPIERIVTNTFVGTPPQKNCEESQSVTRNAQWNKSVPNVLASENVTSITGNSYDSATNNTNQRENYAETAVNSVNSVVQNECLDKKLFIDINGPFDINLISFERSPVFEKETSDDEALKKSVRNEEHVSATNTQSSTSEVKKEPAAGSSVNATKSIVVPLKGKQGDNNPPIPKIPDLLKNYEQKINRKKLDLLIEFIGGGNKSDNNNSSSSSCDSLKKQKSSNNSVAKNHDSKTEIMSAKNTSSSCALNGKDNIKEPEKKAKEHEKSEQVGKQDKACKETKREENLEFLKVSEKGSQNNNSSSTSDSLKKQKSSNNSVAKNHDIKTEIMSAKNISSSCALSSKDNIKEPQKKFKEHEKSEQVDKQDKACKETKREESPEFLKVPEEDSQNNNSSDSLKKQKSSNNSVAKNHDSKTEIMSAKNTSSSCALNGKENIKEPEKKAKEHEKSEQVGKQDKACKETKREENSEFLKVPEKSSQKKTERPKKDSRKPEKSSNTEMTVTCEEVKIINIVREILKVQSHFCQSCNTKSPVGSVWINPTSGKVKCLNCFKNFTKCNKLMSETKNVIDDLKKSDSRMGPEEKHVSASKAIKRTRSLNEDPQVTNSKKPKTSNVNTNKEQNELIQNSLNRPDPESKCKKKSDCKDIRKGDSRDLRDKKTSLKERERQESCDSKHEDRVSKMKFNREAESSSEKNSRLSEEEKKRMELEREEHRRKMLEKLYWRTKLVSWAVLKESEKS